MKPKNNEQGGALVAVLLIAVVFTVLGMGLLAMNISVIKGKKQLQ